MSGTKTQRMMLVLLLLCCVPLALSDPITARCCLPRQWTAVVMENGGINLPDGPAVIDYVTNMSLDMNKMMLRMDRVGYLRDKPETETMIFDYKEHHLYFLKDGYCTPTNLLATPPELCLSHNSYHYEGRHVIGSKGNNIISDAWTTTTNANVTMTLYLTEDCIPLTQVYTDLASQYPTQTILTYSSFKEGVSAGQFVLPSNCHT